MSVTPDDETELRRLRWRCRRGMRELDQLMLRYLDQRWREAPASERARFERLLEVEDDRLWRWFMGRETPQDPSEKDLHALVERIIELPH